MFWGNRWYNYSHNRTWGFARGSTAPLFYPALLFFSGLTQLASLNNVSGTTFTFKQGDGSLNSPGADAFGIPANAAGEYYRFDVQSTEEVFFVKIKSCFQSLSMNLLN